MESTHAGRQLIKLVLALPPSGPRFGKTLGRELDAACARAVCAFPHNINVRVVRSGETLLHIVFRRDAPLTLAALAARPDMDPYRFDYFGFAVIADALYKSKLSVFLGAFPDLDVNAPCTDRGETVLALCARGAAPYTLRALPILLAAGAEVTEDMWGRSGRPKTLLWDVCPELKAVVAPHTVRSERRAWMVACVSIALQ